MGYRVEDRKLILDEEEAATVRRIFERYLALRSISKVQAELRLGFLRPPSGMPPLYGGRRYAGSSSPPWMTDRGVDHVCNRRLRI